MVPEVVKYRLWNLALRQNPQQAKYSARAITGTPTPAGNDTLTDYVLLRVLYRDLNRDEIALAGATLEDALYVFIVLQVDLDQAQAPTPKIGYELSFASGPFAGTFWIAKRVRPVAMAQAFELICQQGRPQ